MYWSCWFRTEPEWPVHVATLIHSYGDTDTLIHTFFQRQCHPDFHMQWFLFQIVGQPQSRSNWASLEEYGKRGSLTKACLNWQESLVNLGFPVHRRLTCKVYLRALKLPEVTGGGFSEMLNYCFTAYHSGSASLIPEKQTPAMFVRMETSMASSIWWLRQAALFRSFCFQFIQWLFKRYHQPEGSIILWNYSRDLS